MRIFFRAQFFAAVVVATSCSNQEQSGTSSIVVEKNEAELFSVVYGDEFRIKRQGHSYVLAEIDTDLELNLSQTIHQNRGICGGFFSHQNRNLAQESFDALENQSFESSSFEAPQSYNFSFDRNQQVDSEMIRASIESLSGYKTRYYESQTGVDSQMWLKGKWEAMGSSLEGFSVETFTHTWMQPSVIATWIGTESPDEVVILGGHGDSIAQSLFFVGPVSPGADDNASGVSAITEVVRVLTSAGVAPKKTIKFISYAAEEVGLKGSEVIAKKYKQEQINVKAVMQLDMTNHPGTDNGTVAFITDHTNADLTNYTQNLAQQLEIPSVKDKCGYACSDHASWTKYGFASVFPFEAKFDDYNPKIHTKDDTLANSDSSATHASKFSKIAVAFLESLAF